MDKQQHSPIPWQICDITLYRGEEMIKDAEGKYVCSISNRPESEANRNLIVVAPELLKQLDFITKIARAYYNFEKGNKKRSIELHFDKDTLYSFILESEKVINIANSKN